MFSVCKFESFQIHHVGVSFVSLAPTYFISQNALMPLLLLFKLQALCPGCQFDETADLNTDFCQYNASLRNRSILETVFLFMNLAPVIIRFEED